MSVGQGYCWPSLGEPCGECHRCGGGDVPAPEFVGESVGGMRVYSSPLLGRGEVILMSEDPYRKAAPDEDA